MASLFSGSSTTDPAIAASRGAKVRNALTMKRCLGNPSQKTMISRRFTNNVAKRNWANKK
jgi:hypothetical protein